ncbi:MAG: FkbM family methyltransferase [Bacteroidota bacterium]
MRKIKALLKKSPFIAKIIMPAWKVMKGVHKTSATYWIDQYLPHQKMILVQIGANDGKSGDPLYNLIQKNTNWHVLFVEPVTYLFQQLKYNYGSVSRLKFENSGINEDGRSQTFYMIGKKAFDEIPDLSSDYKQIGSFNKEHVISLGGKRTEKFIEEIEVNCLTLQKVFDKNQVEILDALLIDAEGYDWKILRQLNLHRYSPRIIYFEHTHLESSEKTEALNQLGDLYYLFEFGINFLCIKKDLMKPGDLRYLKKRLSSKHIDGTG